MNAGDIVQVEIALKSLAEDCRFLAPQGLPKTVTSRAYGYLGGFTTGLEHLAGMLDELIGQLRKLRTVSHPLDKQAALEMLRQCRHSIAQELELYLYQPDQWGAGQSTACRWCLPSLDDIIWSVEHSE